MPKSKSNPSTPAKVEVAHVAKLTPKARASEINSLLAKLRDANDSREKKRIRRGLRRRGYYISRTDTHKLAKAK